MESEEAMEKGAQNMSPLSHEARDVFMKMGAGMILGVPRDATVGPARLFRDARWPTPFSEADVALVVSDELIASGLISELTEFENNYKCGWREMDLPGETYHMYARTQ
jgi:hypothetical protein